MLDFRNHKLGALRPHPAGRSKRVAFAKLFGTDLPAPAPAMDWTEGVTRRPMFGNNKVGDCTCAAVANILVGALKAAYEKDWAPSTDQVLALYSAITGYDPNAPKDANGENPTDKGAIIEDVLAYVMKHGAFGHQFVGTAAIDVGDFTNIKRAIDWFGVVDLGVGLPLAWQETNKWTLDGYNPQDPEWKPYSWGGHCICSEKYDADYIYVWTWGELVRVSWDAFRLYFDTADAVIAASWIKAGISPAHISLVTLEWSMAALKS
ncbi:MAG TPA: hypothetical protein VLZ74_02605 [Methylocella sp.]|nr:hypothetical protein [Methylocella sp.]